MTDDGRTLGVVRSLIGRRSTSNCVVYECRRCGASLESEEDDCPYCGPTDVARYEIH